jgi:hypothetical protein
LSLSSSSSLASASAATVGSPSSAAAGAAILNPLLRFGYYRGRDGHQNQRHSQDHRSAAALLAAAAAAGFVALGGGDANNRKADCCGIAGVVATSNHDGRYVLLLACPNCFSVAQCPAIFPTIGAARHWLDKTPCCRKDGDCRFVLHIVL